MKLVCEALHFSDFYSASIVYVLRLRIKTNNFDNVYVILRFFFLFFFLFCFLTLIRCIYFVTASNPYTVCILYMHLMYVVRTPQFCGAFVYFVILRADEFPLHLMITESERH